MEYDEKFLLKAADRFEQQARAIVYRVATRYTLFGLVGSFAFAVGLDYIMRHEGMPGAQMPVGTIILLASIASLAAGVFVGREQAFKLRVEVHKLLALVEIHRAHRRTAEVSTQPLEIETQPHA